MSTIKIHCKYDEECDIRSIKKHPKNPNNHTREQIERLAELYKYHGIRHPIIVSNLSGFVVAGHCRLLAAKSIGLTSFPVVYQDFASEAAEYSFLVADNAIAQWAELDVSSINMEIPNLGAEFDIDWLALRSTINVDLASEPKEKNEPTLKDVDLKTCPNCGVLIE